MAKFKCSICGQEHKIYRTLILPEPSLMLNMNEKDRKERITVFESRFFTVDKVLIYTKGNLFLKVNQLEEVLHWQVWVSFKAESFLKMLRTPSQSKSSLQVQLESDLPYYKDTLGLKVQLVFHLNKSSNDGPQVIIPESKSELSKDYWGGISERKLHRWMHNLQHLSGYSNLS